jgi:hypothetical protein
MRGVIACMWITTATLYACATVCAWLAVLVASLPVSSLLALVAVLLLIVAYCLGDHTWRLTVRCRDAVVRAVDRMGTS